MLTSTIMPDRNHTDCMCMDCMGTGILSMSDPERPDVKVSDEYCHCQAPLLADDDAKAKLKFEQHKADLRFVDGMMAAQGFEALSDDDLAEVAWSMGANMDHDGGFNDIEIIGVLEARKYREPEPMCAPYSDDSGIGQGVLAGIARRSCVDAFSIAVPNILDTSDLNILVRQYSSGIFKNFIAEYRRAEAVLANIEKGEGQ